MSLQRFRKREAAASRVAIREPFEATTPKEREFRELFRRCETKALAIAELYVGRDQAEDVVQEVAIRIYDGWDELPPEAHTDGYVLTAVRNKAIDYDRRDSKYEELPESLDEVESLQVPAADPFTNELRAIDVIGPVLKTVPAQRRRVWLMRLQGMSSQEIADHLQIDAQVVRKYMRMATTEVAAGLEKGGIAISFESLRGLLPERTSEATND